MWGSRVRRSLGGRLRSLLPPFLFFDPQSGVFQPLFNYTRIWLLNNLLLVLVSLLPLLVISGANYQISRKAVLSEQKQQLVRLVSNAQYTMNHFVEERVSALRFLAEGENCEYLCDYKNLSRTLDNLKLGFGGVLDLGVIDETGLQVAYSGPYRLLGKKYADQQWFQETMRLGSYVSEVFLGFRGVPHTIVAVRSSRTDGEAFAIRATLEIQRLVRIMNPLRENFKNSDALLINLDGRLQVPSQQYGGDNDLVQLPVPPHSTDTEVVTVTDKTGRQLLMAYAYIAHTPFILALVTPEEDILQDWAETRSMFLWFFGFFFGGMALVNLASATYVTQRIFETDQKRLDTLHAAERSNRLASIGSLAAGVAHEINNPLAIINEKAGLIKDLFELQERYAKDERLMTLLDSILATVQRTARITRQLLDFARNSEVEMRSVSFSEVIGEIMNFFDKESAYKGIAVTLDIPQDLPNITTDRGKIQQIFINLITNAFQAMTSGGALLIAARSDAEGNLVVTVQDTGCGISEKHLKGIFDPFFTTKKTQGGTGLGLSIVYGLVRSLDGEITVQSEVGVGTTFTVTLPLEPETQDNACPTC